MNLLEKYTYIYHLILEGFNSSVHAGPLTDEQLKMYFSNSLDVAQKNGFSICVFLKIHSIDGHKGHDLHKIPITHDQTFQKVSTFVYRILTQHLDEAKESKFFMYLTKENIAMFLKCQYNEQNKKLEFDFINTFILRRKQIEKASLSDVYNDSTGKEFIVISEK